MDTKQSYKDKRQPVRGTLVCCRRCGESRTQMDRLKGSEHYICVICSSELGLQREERK